ncbi:MAG: glycosyltransferase [Nitrospiraceae bacterium]|nr:glycosyltransferase [Nitrospiraceae bacterium]
MSSKRIKVLQTCEELTGDGGSIAVQRLHFGMKKVGIDARVLCVIKKIESPDIKQLQPSRIQRRMDLMLQRFSEGVGLNRLLDVTSFRLAKHKAVLDNDILILNAPSYGFCSFLAYPLLTKGRPTLFPVKDMWSFTGHCYHSLECGRWKIGCGNCPHPDLYPPIRRDNTHLEWKLKDWAYSHSHLTVIVPSTWMMEQVKQSMLNRFPIHHIPHGVDTEIYRPMDTEKCRATLGIPKGKKVIMFLAANLANRLKGGDLLMTAIRRLPASLKGEIVMLLLGHKGDVTVDSPDIRTIHLGYVASDYLKATYYSAADLFVHPTRADVFPYAVLESLACGTPIVSFRIGGVPDAIRPGITGYLAEPENAEELSDLIVQLLEDESLCLDMGRRCREIAIGEYSLDLQVQRHIDLCHLLLKQ